MDGQGKDATIGASKLWTSTFVALAFGGVVASRAEGMLRLFWPVLFSLVALLVFVVLVSVALWAEGRA